MWQVLYLQMSSYVPSVSFQGWVFTQMGPAKNQEEISFPGQEFLVHKTHGHLLQGIAVGRRKLKTVHAEPVPKVSKNVGRCDLSTYFVQSTICMNSHLSHLQNKINKYSSSCEILISQTCTPQKGSWCIILWRCRIMFTITTKVIERDITSYCTMKTWM